MDMTIDQQVALDEALVVYDVLRLTPFNKAFLVIADVPKIYMQEFWATATVHHHSIRFKINDKKCIVNLEYFREMMHIRPRIPNQTFDELPFEEEIIAFLRYLGHNREIKKITDVNINKLHQPWRSFAAVINKCLSGKSTGYDSLRHKTLDFRKGKQPAKSSKAKGLFVLSEVALTEAEQMKLATKRSLQQTHISQASGSGADEGTCIIPGVFDVPTNESDEEISWKSSDEDDDDDVDDQSDVDDEDDDDQEDEDELNDDDQDNNDDDQDDNDDDQDSDNDDDDFVHPKLSTHDEEAKDEERFDPIVQTPSQVENSDDDSNDDESHGLNVGETKDRIQKMMKNLLEDTHVTLTPVNPDGQQQSLSVSSQFVTCMFNLSPDAGIDYLFESTPWVDVLVTTTIVPLLVTAPTLPPPIMSQVQQAPTHIPTTAPSTSLQFVGSVSSILGIVDRYIDHRMNEAVKVAQVNEQVKVQVFKILPKIKKIVNEQLEAKHLTLSSNSSKTSYAVAADLSELELKKILIEKMESYKSIHRLDEQKNLYKALVDAYEYRGSMRRREGKEPESISAPKEKASKTTGKSTEGSKSHQKTTTTYGSIQPWISDLAKQVNPRASFNELMDTPVDFLAFLMNRLNIDTLTPKLLAGPTYELMKGSCKSLVELEFFLEEVYKAITNQLDRNNPEGLQYPHNLLKPLPLIPNSRGRRVIPFDHFINSDLEYLRGGASSRKYTTSITKTKAADYGHIKESARDVYSKRRIIAVTELQIVEWHNYKHLDWINVRRDDDKLYKFKEGNLKRLRIQDIKDMLLLLVQGKLTNLTVEERFAFNVSLRGFIYQNKDKQNRLMRIDELHKFNDDTLNDVRTALDDRLKGIRIKYLPQTFWRKSDKEIATAMIHAIDKQLKTKRIKRSLEKFVGGRLYEGDFRMLQRTI
nr:hypothetical protein [Tanacetum cinerariifolium]